MYKWEKKCFDFIHDHLALLLFFIISALAIFIRLYMFPFQSNDFTTAFQPWFDFIKTNGNLAALKFPVGDYTFPYMAIFSILTYLPFDSLVLIKIVSVGFDFILAAAAAAIVHQLVKGHMKNPMYSAVIAFIAILFLPTVLLNSALWGQCDSIYVSFLLLFILFMIKERYLTSFLFFGLAIAFKLQSIFLLPALILYCFLSKKISIKYFLIIPAVIILASLPAIIAGRPIVDMFGIYIYQINEFVGGLSYNYPNIPFLFNGADPAVFIKIFNILAIVILITGFAILFFKNLRPKKIDFIGICIWSAYACVLFLPEMHERYGYIIEVLSVVFVIVRQKQWYLAIGLNLFGLLSYMPYLFKNTPINLNFLSIANFLIFIIFSLQSLRSLQQRSSDLEISA